MGGNELPKGPDGFLARTVFSLPTEAEWEYAARGGTSTAFSFGDACNADTCDACVPADDFMWWCGNAENSTHPVGEKMPNPFGIHDLHGNVFELCQDVYKSDFYADDVPGFDPVSDVISGSGRVARGGSFDGGYSKGGGFDGGYGKGGGRP